MELKSRLQGNQHLLPPIPCSCVNISNHTWLAMHGACYADSSDLAAGGRPSEYYSRRESRYCAVWASNRRQKRDTTSICTIYVPYHSTPENGRSTLFQPYDQLCMHENPSCGKYHPSESSRRESHVHLGWIGRIRKVEQAQWICHWPRGIDMTWHAKMRRNTVAAILSVTFRWRSNASRLVAEEQSRLTSWIGTETCGDLSLCDPDIEDEHPANTTDILRWVEWNECEKLAVNNQWKYTVLATQFALIHFRKWSRTSITIQGVSLPANRAQD